MTKRTQRFVFLGVAILVVGLGTGLVASYVGLPNLPIIGSSGPAELAYVPSDTTVVAHINVRDVMDSQLRQRFLKLSPGADSAADHFQQETGINIQTDVDRVVVALRAAPEVDPRPLVLARGVFDKARIEAAILAKGGAVADYNGQRLISFENEVGLAFVEPDLAVVGEPNAVRRAIDTKASGKSVADNADMMRFVRDLDNGNIWAVAHLESLSTGRLLPQEISQQLPAVTWVSFSGQVDDGVRAAIRAETRDEKAANDLRDVFRGFVALARLQTSQHPELAELLNSIELGGQGTTVSLGIAIPPAIIDLLGALRAREQRPRDQVPGASAPRRPLSPAL